MRMVLTAVVLLGCQTDTEDTGQPTQADDLDMDGVSADNGDCDDTDPDIVPGAEETCDGVDQDCNGVVDDNPTDGETYYRDDDADGFGDPEQALEACARPDGYAPNGDDCDDRDPLIHPDGVDADGMDRNCDNKVDSGPIGIEDFVAACDPSDRVTYTATVTGAPARGAIFAQETGAVWDLQWSDNHGLDFVAGESGSDSRLGVTLETGASVVGWAPGVSTVFTCSSHFEGFDMTYALAAYDDAGQIVDCIVIGDDPTDLVYAESDRTNEPDFDPRGCRVVP